MVRGGRRSRLAGQQCHLCGARHENLCAPARGAYSVAPEQNRGRRISDGRASFCPSSRSPATIIGPAVVVVIRLRVVVARLRIVVAWIRPVVIAVHVPWRSIPPVVPVLRVAGIAAPMPTPIVLGLSRCDGRKRERDERERRKSESMHGSPHIGIELEQMPAAHSM